jgi:GrpB-like predicted nucleotidyltransferase (UPF0157 family)
MRKIEVVAYDAGWPVIYKKEANLIGVILGDELIRIHHIGSTSVPGLAAKPVIDMLAEVRSIEALDSFDQQMALQNYTTRGEYGIPGRRYYFKGTEEMHSHHLHAFQAGHPEIARHLLFRDYLRVHPDEAREYAGLKTSLAVKFTYDINSYMDGKDAFIKELDRRALIWSQSEDYPSGSSDKR